MLKFFKLPIIRIPIRYGLIAGVFGFALMMLLYYFNRHPSLVPPFLDFRILLFSILIVFSLREVRDFHQDGVLYFWQGMIGSFIFTLAYAFLASLLIYLYTLINPEFVSSYIELGLEQIKRISQEDIDRLGKEGYQQLLVAIPKADGYFLASKYFYQSFMISLFLSIIISVVLRRQPKSQ
jgi:hypothetical protein